MFKRESQGQYMFGTRQVLIKIAQEKLQCKVGGGFLLIEKFLEQYTPLEMEKIGRKTPTIKVSRKNEQRTPNAKTERRAMIEIIENKQSVLADKDSKKIYESSPMRHQFVPSTKSSGSSVKRHKQQ